MMEEFIHNIFTMIGHTWNIGGNFIVPSAESIRRVLDAAAGGLYDSDVDTQLQTGGLIIEKTEDGHDVYVYVGNYK